jgi:prefoldin subunit 5
VITNAAEYEKAHTDLRILEQRIADLERDHPVGEKGFTKAGVRKMIAKINEELAVFESREEARLATPR